MLLNCVFPRRPLHSWGGDLEGYKPLIRGTAHIHHRGHKVTSTIAPSSGTIVLSALNILDGYKLDSVHDPTQPGGVRDSHQSAHIIVESMKVCHPSLLIMKHFDINFYVLPHLLALCANDDFHCNAIVCVRSTHCPWRSRIRAQRN